MFCLAAISLSAYQKGSSRLTLVGWPLILTDLFSFDDVFGKSARCLGFTR